MKKWNRKFEVKNGIISCLARNCFLKNEIILFFNNTINKVLDLYKYVYILKISKFSEKGNLPMLFHRLFHIHMLLKLDILLKSI